MRHRLSGEPRPRGFSLIEIMVVLAIVGILSAIAYPAYQEQVRKSRRADAQAVLMAASEFLERFHTENMRFDQNVAGVGVALPAGLAEAPLDGATKYYTISLDAVAAQTYLLRAVPKNAQSGDSCGDMTLSNVGAKSAALATCWLR